jgi:hypothetical protein
VRTPGSEVDGVADPFDEHRFIALFHCSVAELSCRILPPAIHVAAGCTRAGVLVAHGNLDDALVVGEFGLIGLVCLRLGHLRGICIL